MALADTRGLVVHSERLFYNALRVSGWCHQWGNLMKFVAEKTPGWHDTETGMRQLVDFWGNKSWRIYTKKVMQGTDYDVKQSDHWHASMAKWRYETIPSTMEDLKRVKTPSQHMRMEFFLTRRTGP